MLTIWGRGDLASGSKEEEATVAALSLRVKGMGADISRPLTEERMWPRKLMDESFATFVEVEEAEVLGSMMVALESVEESTESIKRSVS
jgi:hypothetical protein